MPAGGAGRSCRPRYSFRRRWLYKTRYAELAKLNPGEVDALIPLQRQEWKYFANADEDWQGFEGFIKDPEEIDRLANALRQAAEQSEPSAVAHKVEER